MPVAFSCGNAQWYLHQGDIQRKSASMGVQAFVECTRALWDHKYGVFCLSLSGRNNKSMRKVAMLSLFGRVMVGLTHRSCMFFPPSGVLLFVGYIVM